MVGPGVAAFVSKSSGFGFGDDVGPERSLDCGTSGGGSITECVGDFWTTAGSGRAAIVSAEEVSIVMCLVGGDDFLAV
jgi:hypothetical protein